MRVAQPGLVKNTAEWGSLGNLWGRAETETLVNLLKSPGVQLRFWDGFEISLL